MPTPSLSPSPKLQRVRTWSGLRPGDAVVVNTPKERSHHFEFVAYVRNVTTNDAWVEVRGGRRGESKDRSFHPDDIFPAASRHGNQVTGLSLADAPQLPLS